MTWAGVGDLNSGLFVPKPSRGTHCQRCGMLVLGTIVRRCPLASAASDGRRYSLGYSVPRCLLLGHHQFLVGSAIGSNTLSKSARSGPPKVEHVRELRQRVPFDTRRTVLNVAG